MGRDESSGARPWVIQGGFLIEADNQADAERALEQIERTAARTYGSVTIHVHISEDRRS